MKPTDVSRIRSCAPDKFVRAEVGAYVTRGMAQHIMSQDAERLKGNITVRDEYRSGDLYSDVNSYFISINTWACLIEDLFDIDAAKQLVSNIWHHGLFAVIKEANQLADTLKPTGEFWELGITFVGVEYQPLYWGSLLNRRITDPTGLLQALVFLRRFGCKWTRSIPDIGGLNKFLTVNTNCRDWGFQMRSAANCQAHFNSPIFTDERMPFIIPDRCHVLPYDVRWDIAHAYGTRYASRMSTPIIPDRPLSRYWLRELRETAHELLGHIPLVDMSLGVWNANVIDVLQFGYFSSGVTAEGCHTIAEKVCKMAQSVPFYKDPLYPLVGGGNDILCAGVNHLRRTQYDTDPLTGDLLYTSTKPGKPLKSVYSEIKGVPKDHESLRIIAEEFALNGFLGQAVAGYMEDRLRSNKKVWKIIERRYTRKDQTNNQGAAVQGSSFGALATIDLSSASDSISRELLRLIDPEGAYLTMMSVASTSCKVGSRLYDEHMAFTSGTGLTSINESIVFLIVCYTCEKVFYRWTHQRCRSSWIYNDDLVVDTRIYDMVCDVLHECGFIVNGGKSFGAGTLYRESCGIESYGGYHFSHVYWSRKGYDIQGSAADGLAGLIQLQHRLYSTSPKASKFITDVVMDICPDMTISQAGTDCSDLWGTWEYSPYLITPPSAVIVEKDGVREFSDAPISPDVLDKVTRVGHATPISDYSKGSYEKGMSDEDKANLAMYQYAEWLQHTPPMEKVPYIASEIEVIPDGHDRKALIMRPKTVWVITS